MDLASATFAERAARQKRPLEYSEDQQQSIQSEAHKKLLAVLRKLQRHPMSDPFLQPVDTKAVTDYLDLVKEPMDLSTVESRLFSGKYSSAHEFSTDIRKIWSNAFTYNPPESDVYQASSQLSAFFESLFTGHESLILSQKGNVFEGLYKQLEALKKEIKDIKEPKSTKPSERPMTLQEKKNLGQNIRALPPQYLRGLINIIKNSLPASIQGTELEIDLDTLPTKVCRDLEKYVQESLAGRQTKVQDVDSRLETLAQAPAAAEESSSSSSSSSSDEDNLPAGAEWLQYQEVKGESEAFLSDFDRPL